MEVSLSEIMLRKERCNIKHVQIDAVACFVRASVQISPVRSGGCIGAVV